MMRLCDEQTSYGCHAASKSEDHLQSAVRVEDVLRAVDRVVMVPDRDVVG